MFPSSPNASLHCCQGYLKGVVEWEHGQVTSLCSEPIMWSNDVRSLLALCNDLTPLSRDKVTGPEDEVKVFKKIEATFVVSELLLCVWQSWCLLPLKLQLLVRNMLLDHCTWYIGRHMLCIVSMAPCSFVTFSQACQVACVIYTQKYAC